MRAQVKFIAFCVWNCFILLTAAEQLPAREYPCGSSEVGIPSEVEIPIEFRFVDEKYNANEIMMAHTGEVEIKWPGTRSGLRIEPVQVFTQNGTLIQKFCVGLPEGTEIGDLESLYHYGFRQLSLRARPVHNVVQWPNRAYYRMERIKIFNQRAPEWAVVTNPKVLVNERKNLEVQFDLLNDTTSVIPAAEVYLEFHESDVMCISTAPSTEFIVEIRSTRKGLRVVAGVKNETRYEQNISVNTDGCGAEYVTMNLGDTRAIDPKSSRRISYEFVNTRERKEKKEQTEVSPTIGGFKLTFHSVLSVSAEKLASMKYIYMKFRGRIMPRGVSLGKK